MKYLLSASALTLFANLALADNIYGDFNSPELDTNYGNSNRAAAAPAYLKDQAQLRSTTGERLSAYDQLMLGSPDGSPVLSAQGARTPVIDRQPLAQAGASGI